MWQLDNIDNLLTTSQYDIGKTISTPTHVSCGHYGMILYIIYIYMSLPRVVWSSIRYLRPLGGEAYYHIRFTQSSLPSVTMVMICSCYYHTIINIIIISSFLPVEFSSSSSDISKVVGVIKRHRLSNSTRAMTWRNNWNISFLTRA